MLVWQKKQTGIDLSEGLICFEHTGLYSLSLAMFLDEQQILFSMVAALEIKRSLGIVRGKNDKIDAKRIAACLFKKRPIKTFCFTIKEHHKAPTVNNS